MPHAPSAALSRRHAAIRQSMLDQALEALIVISLPNIAWLTNYAGSSAIVVLTADALHFITDSRYVTAVSDMRQTPHECPGLELVVVDGSYDVTLAGVLASGGFRRIGFEAAHLTVNRFNWLTTKLASSAPQLVAVDGVVEIARSVKDPYEIGLLRTAGEMLSQVTRDVLGVMGTPQAGDDLPFIVERVFRLPEGRYRPRVHFRGAGLKKHVRRLDLKREIRLSRVVEQTGNPAQGGVRGR